MTTRGAPALVLNGFKYIVNRKNASGKIYWRCEQTMWRISDNRRWCAVNRQCGGSVTTEDGVASVRKC